MKKKESGFTVFEMLVVVAIIAILSSIALPNFISWRSTASLRGNAFNLKSDLEMAKTRAIKGGGNVDVAFSYNGYEITQIVNGDTDVIIKKKFDELNIVTTLNDNKTSFDNRGMASVSGDIELTKAFGKKKTPIIININRLGLISMNK